MMLQLKAPAKINLVLDIIGKRQDGYHEVRMVMQTIALFDEVTLRRLPGHGISLQCDHPEVPTDAKNIMVKAAYLLQKKFCINKGVEMVLKKRIPVAAGLAGGSADGAAVLKGLNQLWNLNLSDTELMTLAGELGSDLPFCLVGGTALATGRGERIQPLFKTFELNIVLIKPDFGVSTQEVYQQFRLEKVNYHPDINQMIQSLQNQDVKGIAGSLGNLLEDVTLTMYPQLKEIKSAFKEYGALGALMSGSGPTIFGIFENSKDAFAAKTSLNERYPHFSVFFAPSYSQGVEFL